MDNKAQIGGFGAILGVVGVLVVLIVYFSIIPLLGDRIDQAADIRQNDCATGALTFSGNVSDTETVIIGGVTFEFDTEGNTTAGNVAVAVADVLPATATVNLSAAVNGNATTAALVTSTPTSTTVTLTADAAGTAGNSIATTETCANATFGASTLTGGETASEWASDGITTSADLWEDNGSMIAVAMIIVVVSVILLVLRGGY
jgi:hypothetical protein